jgi:hypothetical protein
VSGGFCQAWLLDENAQGEPFGSAARVVGYRAQLANRSAQSQVVVDGSENPLVTDIAGK